MDGSFRSNLTFLIHEHFGPNYKDKLLAEALGVDRSTINRMRSGAGLPGRDRLEALSRYFGVAPEMWLLPREKFVAEFHKLNRPTDAERTPTTVAVSMRTITYHRHLWRECFEIHEGQYIVYWKANGQDKKYVASLLEISSLGQNGLEFSLVNPYIRDDIENDEIRIWRYTGVVYPVAENLYFYGEQQDSNYELFSMITTASPITPPDILRGCMSGIYVKDGKKQIAVNIAVVLAFVKKPINDWRNEIGERLGKLPAGKVSDRIRKLIDPYPGVIQLE